MPSASNIKCFLSYNPAEQAAVDAIVAVLNDADVDTFAAQDVVSGQAITPSILSALRAADFLCIILLDEPLSANMAFETGLAIGLGMPVLALSQRQSVPFDVVPGVQVIRPKSGDLSSALPDIRRFARHVRPKVEHSRGIPNPTAIEKARADLASARLSNSPSERSRALVDIVASVFQQPGIELLQEDNVPVGNRPDLLLWSDRLVSELGGPLIVECKYYGGGAGSILNNAHRTMQQLTKYVEQSSAGLGLLVFDHDRMTSLSLNEYNTPRALAFYVSDLIEAVAAGTLSDEIWHRRARATRLRGRVGDPG